MLLNRLTLSTQVPPEITAQCLDGGISFIIARQSLSLWEVGIDQEPLTEQLVAQRGYRLYNDSHRTILEVPVFSVGYTYEVRGLTAQNPQHLGAEDQTGSLAWC